MNRRSFLATSAAMLAASSAAHAATTAAGTMADSATVALSPPPAQARWRRFEIVTEVELRPDAGATRLWLPLPLSQDSSFQRSLGVDWSGNAVRTGIARDPRYGAPAFHAEWQGGGELQTLVVRTVVETRNRRVDLARPARPVDADRDELALYLQPTAHIPTDGIVRDTARKATLFAARDTLSRARAIYEWIVENTFRDPKTAGCGTGDIVDMLESGRLGGKCADLSALFVGLARASGIPARDVYGVRVADSATWKSLGRAGNITRAQHCRAEFFDERHGWVPVDPADVRKVVIEEVPDRDLPLDDPRVRLARATLFGAWEMNWIGYNTANDTSLAPPTRRPLGHFMYPHAETSRGVLDPYAPDDFRYTITSKEVTA
jgi:transglutaminase-like putative cysteine protease